MKKAILVFAAVVTVITLLASASRTVKNQGGSKGSTKESVETEGFLVKQDKL
ncbi:MAG: hypothetical protein IM631_12205 [Cytophagales bacterium]|jgi:hypothetical protein|nr:hypothetical protein [Cytophagales bacterium]MCA6372133.1 hypothetical protein [Cytophagales bacterium]MCA6382277.1 hypothetical protein [Cytophagales bacterium]